MAGDAVLAMFARRINEWCSGRYYAARYGGEEFAVILSGNSIEEVVHQAAELRSQVSSKPITYLDLTLKLTASGGLTQLSRGETIESAYARADEGLYRAKKEGAQLRLLAQRNRVVATRIHRHRRHTHSAAPACARVAINASTKSHASSFDSLTRLTIASFVEQH